MKVMHWEWEELREQFLRHRGWNVDDGIWEKYVNNFEELAFSLFVTLPPDDVNPYRQVVLTTIPGTWESPRADAYLTDFLTRFRARVPDGL